MPKFRVEKGHDAWARYATLVDASSAEEAERIAARREYDGEWIASSVAEFDDWEIMKGDTEEVPNDHVLTPPADTLTVAETNIIIAALRLWQKTTVIPTDITDLADDHAEQGNFLTDDEIDVLIQEKLNG